MRAALSLLLIINTSTLSAPQPCNLSVEIKDRKYNGVVYDDGEYFVDETGTERGCVCLKGICSRKCCPFGQAYDREIKQCVDHTKRFNPPAWMYDEVAEGFNASRDLHFLIGTPNCTVSNSMKWYAHPNVTDFKLNTDGTLYMGISDYQNHLPITIFSPNDFCMDNFLNDLKPGPDGTVVNAIICVVPHSADDHYVFDSACMLVSCFFVLLTAGVYAWLPRLRNLHGMILTSYFICFFVAFLSMTVMQILIMIEVHSRIHYVVLSIFIYFFLLGSFFWLNVMCYDIWYTFSGKRGRTDFCTYRSRFAKYCVYALGMPTLMTVGLAALEFSNVPPSVPMMPNLRRNGGFLSKNSRLLYLYAPITFLCVMNFIFFMLTALKIAKLKQQTKKILKSNDSSTHDLHKDNQRLSIYIKLFVVTGFNWTLACEVVSSIYPESHKFWRLRNAYNVLVGPFIFVIFVCKKNTLRIIQNRIRNIFRCAKTDDAMQDVTNNDTNITEEQ